MSGGLFRQWGFRRCLVLSVGGALFAAALILPFPFSGDQALYSLYARGMDGGATLYDDLWDAKQPAIFWFFLVAGRLFGFSEVSVHLAEAGWLIGHGVALALVLRLHLKNPWVAGLMPLTAAMFFVTVDSSELTQLEILISPLILWLAILLADKSPSAWPMLVGGALAGVVAAFKLLDVIVPSVILAASVGWGARTTGLGAQLRRVLWFSLGLGITLTPLYLWVESTGVSDLIWWTWLELPRQVIGIAPRPLIRLIRSSGAFVLFNAVSLVLAAPLVARTQWSSHPIIFHSLAGILGCVLVTLLQLWWSFHFAIFVFPVAGLAVFGLDGILVNQVSMRLLAIALGIAAVPAFALGGEKAIDGAVLLTHGDVHRYRLAFDDYRAADDVARVAPVRDGAHVYVMGNPLVYLVLNAQQSIPINGWSAEQWPERLWVDVADDLTQSGTEAVYVAAWAADVADRHAPWFMDQLEVRYRETWKDVNGTWFVRSEHVAPTGRSTGE